MTCNCDMRTKLVGDGCSECNPEYARDMMPTLEEEIDDSELYFNDPKGLVFTMPSSTLTIQTKKRIINKVLDRVAAELKESALHKHENVAGCLFTSGTQSQSAADIEAINQLRPKGE